MLDAPDPGRAILKLTGAVARRQHDRRSAVRDRRAIRLAKRIHQELLGQDSLHREITRDLGVRIVLRVPPIAHRRGRHVLDA